VHANPLLTLAAVAVTAAALAQPASAFQNLESAYRTTGEHVVAVFEPQRLILQQCSAVINDGRRSVAYGVVVSAEGHILTKASELEGVETLNVTVDRRNFPQAEILGVDTIWDVALLKVEADDLVPVEFAPTSEVPQGTWVLANGATTRTARRALAGIVSAKIREIPAAGGAVLGVVIKDPKGLVVGEVTDKSGAMAAGVEAGDLIVALDGQPVATLEEMAELIKDRKAGSNVVLTIERNGEALELDVRLSARAELFQDDLSRNDMMSGEFSERRSGFPRVMQHDILGDKRRMGGPLLDLDGRCLGMNIARANRTESFAIPVEDLERLAEEMIARAKQPE